MSATLGRFAFGIVRGFLGRTETTSHRHPLPIIFLDLSREHRKRKQVDPLFDGEVRNPFTLSPAEKTKTGILPVWTHSLHTPIFGL